jgi:hypothetical protein
MSKEMVLVRYRDPYGQCGCCMDCYSSEYENLLIIEDDHLEVCLEGLRRLHGKEYMKDVSVERVENWDIT